MSDDIVTRLLNKHADDLLVWQVVEEIKRLRGERDEARREVCDMMHITGFLAGDYAVSRGWDCFPDRKRNVSDEVKNFRTIIERDYNAVVAQRDEARREICRNEADLISLELGGAAIFAASVAKRRGWDCYKETKNG